MVIDGMMGDALRESPILKLESVSGSDALAEAALGAATGIRRVLSAVGALG